MKQNLQLDWPQSMPFSMLERVGKKGKQKMERWGFDIIRKKD